MTTYSKIINWFPIFTGMVIGLTLLTAAAFKQQTSRACFFIGNGAYYALSAEDSYDNPNPYDSFTSATEFVQHFSPDSVFSDFTRALYEKEQNIFVTYKTWSSFVHLIDRIKGVFADFGISNPLEQIIIDQKAQLPSNIEKKVSRDLIVPNCNPEDCYSLDVIPLYHPLLFYGPSAEQLKDVPTTERVAQFKKQCGLLHPYFSKLFHFLVLFNPQDWRMYDTHAGFYYLTPCNTQSGAVNLNAFTQLDTYAAYTKEPHTTCTIHEDDWAFYMDKLFTTTNTNWHVYLTGHGSEPIFKKDEALEEDYNSKGQKMTAWVGGVPGKKFKPFLEFLDTKLNTQKLFLSSCHVPAKRALKLAEKPLSYDIISPIGSYQTVTCYVPCGYITSYVPAWLSGTQQTELNYTLKPSESDACTPLNIPKYSSLLADNVEPKTYRKHIDTFVKAKAFEAPTIIEAETTEVKRLVV